jgi:uncharacterized protein DUF7019
MNAGPLLVRANDGHTILSASMIPFVKSSDLKYFLYISKTKLDMLHGQIAHPDGAKRTFEWKLDAKLYISTEVRRGRSIVSPSSMDRLAKSVRINDRLGCTFARKLCICPLLFFRRVSVSLSKSPNIDKSSMPIIERAPIQTRW